MKYFVYVLTFFSYSFCGWLIEVSLKFIQDHQFINRGFLIGPYCPIYGTGGVLITLLLSKFQGSYLAVFSMSMMLCSILEYLVSWIMEVMFHARWWDYSDKPFNLNGRIWLGNAILFGIGGVLVIEFIDPLVFNFLSHFSFKTLMTLSIILSLLFILDFVFSFFTILSFRNEAFSLTKDATEEIVEMVKDETEKFKEQVLDELEIKTRKLRHYTRLKSEELRLRYNQRSYIHRRLIQAYPKFELRGQNLKKIRQEIQKRR